MRPEHPRAVAIKSTPAAVNRPIERIPQTSAPGWGHALAGYVKMGYEHILPLGLDHILFVLGLVLLATRTKDLVRQITAFTIAHSLTLALALYGVVRLPSSTR